MERTELENSIKKLIVSSLDLEDVEPSDIVTDAPLFKEGLGLDSIDSLELGIALKRKFNLNIKGDDPAIRKHFYSVKMLADFIESQTPAA